jgi:hypothetical protein
MVPMDCLPDDDQLRASWLRRLFPDHVVRSGRKEDRWHLELAWPKDHDWYVDPRLEQGLRWWSPSFDITDIPSAHRDLGGYQLSMLDSWSLLAWSRWLRAQAETGAPPGQLVLLHVDEHDDLMTPHLSSTGGAWRDILTARDFDLLEPESVAGAVASGAVGIASFIVPLLHFGPTVHIRHLAASGASSWQPRTCGLARAHLQDPALGAGVYRPCLRPVEPRSPEAPTYTVTRSLQSWLADLPPGPVFLHIDLDYLNNRYDGDSHWPARSPRHDPAVAEALATLDALFSALHVSGTWERIVNTTVALSPGFFPAELWQIAVERLDDHFGEEKA